MVQMKGMQKLKKKTMKRKLDINLMGRVGAVKFCDRNVNFFDLRCDRMQATLHNVTHWRGFCFLVEHHLNCHTGHLGTARKEGGGLNPCPDGQLRQLWHLKLTQKVPQSARLSAGGGAKAIRAMPK